MKGIFRFLALLLLSASSFAEQPPVGVHAGAWAGAEASARASAGASVKTAQTASQQVAVTVSQPAAAASSGGSKTTTIRSVPDPYAPTVNATSPCRIAVSAGVAVVGIGVSGGGSVEDDPCNLRETARLLDGIGQREAAARVMCNDPRAAEALGPAVCQSSGASVWQEPATSATRQLGATSPGSSSICDQAARFDDPVLAARNDCR